jgi:hypothetical protein
MALSGCMNYQVGTTLPRHLRTIAVEPFKNESGEPNLETELQRAIRQEIQREGQLRLLDADAAAIHLRGTLLSYSLDPMRYDQNRPKTVSEYRVVVRARIEAVEAATGDVLVAQTVVGDSTLRAAGDLATARRTALPEAARQAAHEIVNAVVSAW